MQVYFLFGVYIKRAVMADKLTHKHFHEKLAQNLLVISIQELKMPEEFIGLPLLSYLLRIVVPEV